MLVLAFHESLRWWTQPGRVRRLSSDGIHGREVLTLIDLVFATLRRTDEGQGLAEYALILALIAIVAIVALLFLGGSISSVLSTVGESV